MYYYQNRERIIIIIIIIIIIEHLTLLRLHIFHNFNVQWND